MAILKKFIPLVTEDMLDASVSSQLGSNPNIVKVDAVTDIVGLDKTFEIRSDFTLTANLVLPDDATIIDGGGTIDVGAFDVTFVNTNVSDSKWDFSTGTINASSTFNGVKSINLENYGLIGDGNLITNTGTDNRNVFREASKIAHIAECDIKIEKEGNYLYSLVASNQFATAPTNFYIKGKTDLFLNKGVVIGALTSGVSSYEVLCIYGGKNNRVYGQGEIVGELRTHDFITHGVSEGCHGIVVNNNSENVTIELKVREVPGDCIISKYNPEFIYNNSVIEATFTKDFTINSDGTTTANTDFAYSQRWDVTDSRFSNVGGFVFGGGSFSGWFGLDVQQYSVAFYNATSIDGDTTTGFISKLPIAETYQKIPLPENTTHIRLIINTPSVWGDLLGTIYAPNKSKNIIVKSPLLSWGVRQGISNLPPYSVIDGVVFDMNGRRFDLTPGSPGYGFDSEDGYQNLHHVKIINSVFKNNKGGSLILKGSRYFEIAHNYFDYATVPDWANVLSVSLANSEYTSFHDNIVNGGDLSLGRGNNVYANILKDVTILFTYEDEHVHDIVNGENIYFNDMIDVDFTGTARLSNSTFIYTKPLNSVQNVFDDYRNLHIADVVFNFQEQTYNSTIHKLNNQTGTEEALGSLTRTKIINLTAETTNSGAYHMYVYDVTDTKIETNVSVRRGQPKNVTATNLKVTGWFELLLSDYPATDTGTFTTYKLVNPTIIAGSGVGTGGRDAFTVALKDVNVEIEGGYIEFPASNLMLDFQNYGTRKFTGTTFYSATARTQALTGFEFIDCNFENVTFTGVVFKYSKPHVNAPSYTDNTTALAALGEGFYFKNTTTGEIKPTYTPV